MTDTNPVIFFLIWLIIDEACSWLFTVVETGWDWPQHPPELTKKTKETVSKAPDRSTNNHQTQTSQHKPWMHAISAHCWQHPWGKCVHEKMSKAFEMTKWQNRKIAIQGAIIFDSILMFYHLLLMIIYARRHNSFGGMGRKMTGKLKRSKRSETVSKQTDSTGI